MTSPAGLPWKRSALSVEIPSCRKQTWYPPDAVWIMRVSWSIRTINGPGTGNFPLTRGMFRTIRPDGCTRHPILYPSPIADSATEKSATAALHPGLTSPSSRVRSSPPRVSGKESRGLRRKRWEGVIRSVARKRNDLKISASGPVIPPSYARFSTVSSPGGYSLAEEKKVCPHPPELSIQVAMIDQEEMTACRQDRGGERNGL